MRLPSTTRPRERDARTTPPAGDRATDSRGGLARKLLLLSLGFAAVAYAVSRYTNVPDDFEEIPIGGRDESEIDRSEEGPPTDDAKETVDEDAEAGADADVNDVIDDSETNVDITDEERSAEEISERADENIPEPGEMAVDEDVAEGDDSSAGEASDEE